MLTTQVGSAQDRKPFEAGKFYLGIKAGGNLTAAPFQNNYGQREMDYAFAMGLNGGLFAELHLTGKWYLRGEIAYQQQKQEYTDSFKKQDFEKSIQLNYAVFPVMCQYLFGKTGVGFDAAATFKKPKFYLAAGLQPGVVISGSDRYRINGQNTDFIDFITEGGNPNADEIALNKPPESVEDLYQSFDLLFIGAAGIRQNLRNNVMFFAEARGGIGLLDINAEDWRLPSDDGTYHASRNLFLGLHVGIAVSLF